MRFFCIVVALLLNLTVVCLESGAVTLVPVQDSCRVSLDRATEKIYQAGIDYLKKSNYTLAAQQMRKVLKNEPDCIDAWYALGVINLRKPNNNLEEAEMYFRKVTDQCPSYDVQAWFYLGEISYAKEDYQRTIGYLKKFLVNVDLIKSDEDYDRAIRLLEYTQFVTRLIGNPVPFEPKVVSGISTELNEYLPILSPDNQLAFFTREIKLDPDRNSLVREVKFKERFFFSQMDSSGAFSPGEEMTEPFNIQDNEGGATLTADNKYLYYTVCKFDAKRQYLNCDIWYSEFASGYWQPIKNAGSRINLPDSWESQPSIAADGSVLYLVSDRPGGYGGYDLYRSRKGEDGTWSELENLGPEINSAGNEKSPFIHPDGRTLYFSSDGWPGLGGYDIFFSRLDTANNWKKPVNIGYPINSPDDEVGFFVSTDGTKGFFASNKYKGAGGWDLFHFDLYDGARPEKVLFIKGNIRSESDSEPVRARIELKNMETKTISQIPMDTLTGNYVAVAPFSSDYIMTVKKPDFVYETKYISRYDSLFSLPATVDMEIHPIEVNKSYRINDIHFLFNSFELTPESRAVLDQLIEFLVENTTIHIQIQGHTDNIGNDASNLRLSEQRAESVYNYLIEKGLGAEKLTYKGFGESMPVASNDSEKGRALNRRTVFVITGK